MEHVHRKKSSPSNRAVTPIPLFFHVYSKIHRESDALVNFKLVYAFTYPSLYADAIGLFYPM